MIYRKFVKKVNSMELSLQAEIFFSVFFFSFLLYLYQKMDVN